MNKRIDFSQLGGNAIDQDSFSFMQDSYRGAFAAIAKMIGNNVIITGMNVVGGNISDGWLVYNGELMPFVGGVLGAGNIVVQEDAGADILFFDNSTHKVEYTKQAVLGTPATFNYSTLISFGELKNMWLTGDVKMLHATMDYITANFDNTGLGIGERIGWKVCNGNNGTVNMGDKLPLGYNWANIAGMTDAVKAAKGSTSIAKTNLPAIGINVPIPKGKTSVDQDGSGYITTGGSGHEPVDCVSLTTDALGDGTAYYPASIITLYIVKI